MVRLWPKAAVVPIPRPQRGDFLDDLFARAQPEANGKVMGEWTS